MVLDFNQFYCIKTYREKNQRCALDITQGLGKQDHFEVRIGGLPPPGALAKLN